MNIVELHKIFLKYPNIYIDTRANLKAKGIFFALRGERNGNDYADDALYKGCPYVVVDEKERVKDNRYILVENSLKTLQELAKYHRKYCGTKILALTGTNGKTTTKELIKEVLERKYKVVATDGNLNNQIGVPLTLLRLVPETDIGVIEMGASHVGDIAELCEFTLPDMGLITNIGKAHTEKFETFENIVKTKKELYDNVAKRQGLLFVNTNNTLLVPKLKAYDCPIFSYGFVQAQITGKVLTSLPFLCAEVEGNEIQTKIYGRYNLENILAAYAVGVKLSVPQAEILEAISLYKPTNNRSQYIKTEKNEVIMDAYNANPSSMEELLSDFFEQRNMYSRFCILGDMKELREAKDEHIHVKKMLKENGFQNKAYLVGDIFYELKDEDFRYFRNIQELKDDLERTPLVGKQIVVKGSNSICLYELKDML